MNVFVSGVAGFIGSHLAEKLIEQGHTVYGCDNLSSGSIDNIRAIAYNPNFKFTACDINEYMGSINHHNIDTVYHLACCKKLFSDDDPFRCIETNIKQTLYLMKWAEANKVKRFVHSSTGSIYGQQKVTSVISPRQPVSFYGINKYTAEQYLQFFPMKSTILRYFHVYGYRNRMGVLGKWITALKEGKPITVYGDGTQQRTFTHVDDVVNANLFLMKPGAYNVSTGVVYTLLQVIEMLEAISGKKAVVNFEDWVTGDIREFNVIENTGMKYKDFKVELKKLWDTWSI